MMECRRKQRSLARKDELAVKSWRGSAWPRERERAAPSPSLADLRGAEVSLLRYCRAAHMACRASSSQEEWFPWLLGAFIFSSSWIENRIPNSGLGKYFCVVSWSW